MTQALTAVLATPISTIRSSSASSNTIKTSSSSSCLNVRATLPCQKTSVDTTISSSTVPRRGMISLAIAGAVVGLNLDDDRNAWAAARRPPPPSPAEKKDPNVSGVLAKVLASKKRKEAMKEAMAKQREKGKKIDE